MTANNGTQIDQSLDEIIVTSDEDIQEEEEQHSFDVMMTECSRLSKTVKTSVARLTRREVQYIVKMYYQLQRYRISFKNQLRMVEAEAEAKGRDPEEAKNAFSFFWLTIPNP